jgi:glucose/arabinose dehydrogenase
MTLVACGDDDDDSTSTGGTGGKAGKGGAPSTGGVGVTGGSAAKGGSGGSGGTAGRGGTPSTGGTQAEGGTNNGGAGEGGVGPGEGGAPSDAGAGAGGAEGGTGPGEGGGGGAAGSMNGGAGGEGGSGTADLCRGIELPAGKYFVHDGLCVRAVASDQGKLRQLTFDAQGSLLGVTVDGAILRYRDLNDDGMFSGTGEIVEIANTGGNGNNAHLDAASGYLYAGTPTGVKRWLYSTTSNALGAGEDVVVGQPSTGNHTYHTAHVYDGWLYVSSGSAANVSAPATPEYDTDRSVLKRFQLSTFTAGTPFAWTAGEVFVRGIRNMVGFTRNQAGRMYGVVNGIDDLVYATQDVHLDNPGEDLIRLEAGTAHGYPYCFTASHILVNNLLLNPGTQLAGSVTGFTNPRSNDWCADNSTPPVTFMPPHSAPLDLTFFDSAPAGGLPEEFRGGAFVALHGSWNTTPSVGHQILFIPFNTDGTAVKPTADLEKTTFPFPVIFGGGNATTPAPGIWGWENGDFGETPVRPVGVAISPVDGALYVSSDNASVLNGTTGTSQGYLYRIAMQR